MSLGTGNIESRGDITFCITLNLIEMKDVFQTRVLEDDYDYLAPDKSEIRLLAQISGGNMAHCTLPTVQISKAVKHKTIEEIWYVAEGQGEMWRKTDKEEQITLLKPGVSLSIPVGTHFQFKNTRVSPLRILIVTMPPWPGADEAVAVKGYWDS